MSHQAERLYQWYAEQASRTASRKELVHEHLAVWMLGIAGEVGEFERADANLFVQPSAENRDAVVKEAGDVCWYLAAFCAEIGADFGDIFVHEETAADETLVGMVLDLCDTTKKIVAHHHDGIDQLRSPIEKIAAELVLRLQIADAEISLKEVFEANIEKLRKRYPDGFSPEASRNRTG